jgi:hypothetical protein
MPRSVSKALIDKMNYSFYILYLKTKMLSKSVKDKSIWLWGQFVQLSLNYIYAAFHLYHRVGQKGRGRNRPHTGPLFFFTGSVWKLYSSIDYSTAKILMLFLTYFYIIFRSQFEPPLFSIFLPFSTDILTISREAQGISP